MTDHLPVRSDGTVRPAGLALPPGRMAPWHRGRPLKRWSYVGVFGPELLLCAATARIAGIPQAFWAVLDRSTGELLGRTAFTPGLVAIGDGRLVVAGRGVRIDLALAPAGTPVEVTSMHGRAHIWTRKEPVQARGLVRVGDRTWELAAGGLVDTSAGYHARATTWRWSAGTGTTTGGQDVTWNLVDGVHDAPAGSERTVWVAGVPHETGPAAFDGLDGVRAPGGLDLRFTAEAERARRDDLKVLMSDYRQPLGSFTGTLGDGLELASAAGVMEWHDVRW